MQLARQWVVGLRGGRAGPITEAIGGPGGWDRSHLPAGVSHRRQTRRNGSTALVHSLAHAHTWPRMRTVNCYALLAGFTLNAWDVRTRSEEKPK